LQLISRAGKLMKGTGRQSVLKPPRKLETITHGHRTAQICRTVFGKLGLFRQTGPPRAVTTPIATQGQLLDVALVVSAGTRPAAHLFFALLPIW